MTSHRLRRTPAQELKRDRGIERRMLWKGLLSLAVVVVVVLVRQRYLV
jgi:hypothetical protein